MKVYNLEDIRYKLFNQWYTNAGNLPEYQIKFPNNPEWGNIKSKVEFNKKFLDKFNVKRYEFTKDIVHSGTFRMETYSTRDYEVVEFTKEMESYLANKEKEFNVKFNKPFYVKRN